MEQQDIRWRQRFQNFDKAFKRLDEALVIIAGEPDTPLLQAGLIQTYDDEIATAVIRDIQERYFFLLKDLHTWLEQQ